VRGRQFQTQFLIARRIKQRAAYTVSERLDASHVVMSACKFGCDELSNADTSPSPTMENSI